MKISASILGFLFLALISCKHTGSEKAENEKKIAFEEIENEDYHLIKPTMGVKKILVLFGGYPEKAKDIKREFKIGEIARRNNLAVVFMNYSQKLWLEESEKQILAEQLKKIVGENELQGAKTYFGGFSSGGNITLQVSDYLAQQKSDLTPKGVFIIDSPIDLAALYRSSEKNLERNFSETSVQESAWLIETLRERLGNPEDSISSYERHAVYTSQTDNIDNIKHLKNVKIRLYSEPDTSWWKKNRMADYDQMNAYYIEKLARLLKKSGFSQVEYIPTVNMGFRASGERHPHSWSIVDKDELISWISE